MPGVNDFHIDEHGVMRPGLGADEKERMTQADVSEVRRLAQELRDRSQTIANAEQELADRAEQLRRTENEFKARMAKMQAEMEAELARLKGQHDGGESAPAPDAGTESAPSSGSAPAKRGRGAQS